MYGSFEREAVRPYMRVGVFWRVGTTHAPPATVRSPATILQLHTDRRDVYMCDIRAQPKGRIGNKNHL